MKRLFTLLCLASALVLSGCASTFTSKINTINQFDAASSNTLKNQSFTIQADPQTADDPNFKLAYDEVSARLKELGLTEVASEQATLKLNIQLAIIPGNAHVSFPFTTVSYMVTPSGMVIPFGSLRDPYWSLPSRYPLRYPYSSRYYFGRWDGWYSPWYSPFSPFSPFNRFNSGFYPEANVRQYFDHEIIISLHDAASGKLLYSVKASSNQSDAEIAEHLHLLVETALREFPLKTGETEVELKLENN